MIVYQLNARGHHSWANKIHNFYSRKLFRTKESAEDYKPIFKQKCIDPSAFDYILDNEHLNITILELELEDA